MPPLPTHTLLPARAQVRGPATVARYFKAPQPATDAAGWFPTGDVASIDGWGNMAITDRSKDVIKSGGAACVYGGDYNRDRSEGVARYSSIVDAGEGV